MIGARTKPRYDVAMPKSFANQIKRVIQALRWAWSHKLKTAGGGLAVLFGAYAVVFALVSCSSSPTAEQLSITNERSLAYARIEAANAEGRRVILLHGAPADANSWNRLMKRADDIDAAEIIAVDRIGYGNSTDEDELTLAGHAESVAPLLVEMNGRKPIILGHSYGGPVALRLGVDYADRVGAIVLVAGACDAYMNDAQWFRRMVEGGSAVVPGPWARANRELLALTDENRAMEPLLDRVTCPVVIVHGTWDGVCPHDSTVAYLQERLVNASEIRVLSLDRAGHNLHLSHLDEIIEAIHSIE